LGSLFRYHTRLAGLDWIMSAFGFAFSALIASRRTRLVRGAPHSSDVRGPYDIALWTAAGRRWRATRPTGGLAAGGNGPPTN